MLFSRTPAIISAFPSHLIWKFARNEKKLYLTFDDGPTPDITVKILDILSSYHAKATFFCLGKNVELFPDLYTQIIQAGHSTGNHTQNHLNGWKTRNSRYFDDINNAAENINSKLFRPPYGKIRGSQIFHLKKDYKIIMWEILSGDYSNQIAPEKCTHNVITKALPGSIVVFHDSLKAKNNMLYSLPRVLNHFSKNGYCFEAIQYEKV